MSDTPFISLLFQTAEAADACRRDAPDYFVDLNLDQVVSAIVGQHDAYDLAPLLYTPAPDVETVARRHAVFRDLDDPAIQQAVERFTQGLHRVHENRERMEKARHPHEQSRWLLDALDEYGDVVERFASDLGTAEPASDGFAQLAAYLADYTGGETFRRLRETTRARLEDLDSVRYDLLISELRVEVSRFADEPDYGEIIAETFQRFRGDNPVERDQHKSEEALELNQVEARVLSQVVTLFPKVFARIDEYVEHYADYMDAVVARVDRELRFYLHYQNYIAPMKKAGLAFCYPEMVGPDDEIAVEQACDLALARQLVADKENVVANDFTLSPPERLIVVSGPNQGGKTTFARMVGQLHYLGMLGLPVPAQRAALMRWRGLFTHFERAEDIRTLRGKLEDELVRVHAILERADHESIVIMNEIFSSTTTDDARYLGQRILRALLDAGVAGVCVTFIDDLANLDAAIVSMASTVDADDPAIRTFRIVRKSPDGKAYARSLAAKHRLTREALEKRL